LKSQQEINDDNFRVLYPSTKPDTDSRNNLDQIDKSNKFIGKQAELVNDSHILAKKYLKKYTSKKCIRHYSEHFDDNITRYDDTFIVVSYNPSGQGFIKKVVSKKKNKNKFEELEVKFNEMWNQSHVEEPGNA
jgi:hypothetical protein